jgi:signal transduction histidine kinase
MPQMKLSENRPPQRARLQSRIIFHFVLFAVLMGAILTFGALFFLLEAEDAALDAVLAQAMVDDGSQPTQHRSLPHWIATFPNQEALKQKLNLEALPLSRGPHEVFASEDGQEAILIRSFWDRLQMWRAGWEWEYRLIVETSDSQASPVYYLADWQALEHTEGVSERISKSILVFGGLVLLGSLWLSRRLARSSILPVLELAERVSARTPNSQPLSKGTQDDEVGFLARSLDQSFAQLAGANDREKQFIADCSHELRTPLTILNGAVSLLSERENGDSEVLERLRRTTQRMEGIVRTFLVMAREGRVPGERESVRVRELISQVIAEQRLVFPHHNKCITIKVPVEISVECVREVIRVILENLLGNAFNHAPDTPLLIQWEPCPPFGMSFIAQEIEEPNTRTVGSRPSYGIGLSIVHRLCALHDWHLEEAFDEGPRFTLWLGQHRPADNP